MSVGLTPNQLKQLRALALAEAIGEPKAKNEFQLEYCNPNILAILQGYELTGSRVKSSGPGGPRRQHYWLTAAGIDRLKAAAHHG